MHQETLAGSAVLAVAAAATFGLAGHADVGIGLAAGLLVGSANVLLIPFLMTQGAPSIAGNGLRLLVLSVMALAAAFALGGSMWPVMIGVAAAQAIMVAASVRQGMRQA